MDDTEKVDNTEEIEALVVKYSEAYDKLCQERHIAGQKEYGVFTFLGNDVIRMMAEELADTSNYCRMQYIKLMLLNDLLTTDLADKVDGEGEITMGFEAFKGVGEVGWTK